MTTVSKRKPRRDGAVSHFDRLVRPDFEFQDTYISKVKDLSETRKTMVAVCYARVSSTGQSLEVQLDQLKAVGCEKVFCEKKSGTTTTGREELQRALDYVRDGDTFTVTRLDRLARSLVDLRKIVDTLTAKGVGFRVLHQNLDTTRPEGVLMLSLLGAFAEFETSLRKERQMEGIAKAKAAGRYRGRPATIDATEIAALKTEGLGASAIAKRLGCGRASIYRVMGTRAP